MAREEQQIAKCPCCDGWGTRPDPRFDYASTTGLPDIACPACGGRGVIRVGSLPAVKADHRVEQFYPPDTVAEEVQNAEQDS